MKLICAGEKKGMERGMCLGFFRITWTVHRKQLVFHTFSENDFNPYGGLFAGFPNTKQVSTPRGRHCSPVAYAVHAFPCGNTSWEWSPTPTPWKDTALWCYEEPQVPSKHQGQERKTLAAPSPTFQRPILGNMLLKLGEIKRTGGRPRCVRLPPPPAGALMGRQLSSLLPRPWAPKPPPILSCGGRPGTILQGSELGYRSLPAHDWAAGSGTISVTPSLRFKWNKYGRNWTHPETVPCCGCSR